LLTAVGEELDEKSRVLASLEAIPALLPDDVAALERRE